MEERSRSKKRRGQLPSPPWSKSKRKITELRKEKVQRQKIDEII